MSICGAIITLALNAKLLGDPSLKVSSAREVAMSECSAQNESANPNAVLALKDSKGNIVFSQKIRVADFDFYLTTTQRGGVPAKDAIVFFNYPSTKQTRRAKAIELSMLDAPYKQTTRIPTTIAGLK